MRLFQSPLPLLAALLPFVNAIETHIYIDQIPAYSSLAECAENRLSAIVRAQSSGCGDNMAVTSFSCFCIGSSSFMSSMISTAVASNCAATRTLAASVTPSAQVSSALNIFNSYCARSTELPWFADNSTTTALSITSAPTMVTATLASTNVAVATEPPKSGSSVPVAAIAAPVVIGVLAIAGVIGLLFWLRRRRNAQRGEQVTDETMQPPPNYQYPPGEMDGMAPPVELGDSKMAHEVDGGAVKYRRELPSGNDAVTAAELDGSPVGAEVDGRSKEGNRV